MKTWSYATIKNSFKIEKKSIQDDKRPEKPILVSESIDAVHGLILSDRPIGLNCITEILSI